MASPPSARPGTPIAARLASLAPGGALPVRLRVWDGSVTGPVDGPELVLRDRRALRRLCWSPDQLGLAQAYVAGEIEIDGDLAEGLRRGWRHARSLGVVRVGAAERWHALRLAVRLGLLGPRPAAPNVGAAGRLDGLSSDFYRLFLDRRMTYSCAFWASDAPGYGLEEAQSDKLELICRKLGLEPGMRMLDLGCGWGALAVHAARHYGVVVTGVTRSARQRSYTLDRVASLGLAGAVEIRPQDYRDVGDGPYDAIAAIEMGEYVGAERYPAFAVRLGRLLTPRGRLLVQQVTRGRFAPGRRGFAESCVVPGRHLHPVGDTVARIEEAGLEVRDVHVLREHYVRTLRSWSDALECRWDAAVDLVGGPVARVWRLYLAGSAVACEDGRMGVDQILAVRPGGDGGSGMPRLRL